MKNCILLVFGLLALATAAKLNYTGTLAAKDTKTKIDSFAINFALLFPQKEESHFSLLPNPTPLKPLNTTLLQPRSITPRKLTPAYYTEPPKYYQTEAPQYYTTKAPEYYTIKYSAPIYYTEAPKYYSAPSYYQTEAPKYYTTKAPEYYTTTYAAPSYYTEAPAYYTTYATPSYYTEPPKPARTEIILLYYMIHIVTSAEGSYLSIQSCIAMGGQSHSNASPFEL
ncbi:hypothetical protein OUZ56_027991 [Daphnia magna]|uniref:Uncharacterized protein n=1 Tax=Daphnia magna TaxID=35525 RepID=A0ABR0B2I8_9CRUS|nr:hypothetical protein OUZ56_027991 [Daphnia magna]